MKNEQIVSIILYVIIVLILLFALKSERADTNCADTAQTICGPGKGRAYYNSRPLPGDSRETLLKKLVRTANYDLVTVHWRRVMIVAILVGFLSAFVTRGRIPSGKSLMVHVLIGFLVGYADSIQYQAAVIRPTMKQADDIAARLH